MEGFLEPKYVIRLSAQEVLWLKYILENSASIKEETPEDVEMYKEFQRILVELGIGRR